MTDTVLWRRRGAAFRIAVVLSVFGISAGAYGATFTARVPENFVRASGQPVTVTRTFTVLDPTTTFTLVIHNGGLNNEFSRVSSAVITVNGREAAGPSDFNEQVSLIQKAVTLQAANTFTVELRGAPGSGFALEFIGVDNGPPAITASADRPPNVAGWYNANVVVSFTCFDKTSGVATCPAPVTVSTEGANQIVTGIATDNAGNMATAQLPCRPPRKSSRSPKSFQKTRYATSRNPVNGAAILAAPRLKRLCSEAFQKAAPVEFESFLVHAR